MKEIDNGNEWVYIVGSGQLWRIKLKESVNNCWATDVYVIDKVGILCAYAGDQLRCLDGHYWWVDLRTKGNIDPLF